MHHKNASSIIEAMIVLLIITTGITGVYTLMKSSQDLATATGNRIEAVQIARDGLEAFTNVRDTNWLLFAADIQNCWNVLNYSNACIGNIGVGNDIATSATQGIRISRNANNQFFLGVQNHAGNNAFTDTGYINLFRVQKDSRDFYTQTGGTNFNPTYTREIRVDYLTPTNGVGTSNDEKMRVTSIVQWQDQGSSAIKKLEMDTILTNWKQ